uniref:Uncharacterized protein n=1 Tax=Lotharella oceanica TaxID=641309 RepID=A0A7S2XED1_9EUKA
MERKTTTTTRGQSGDASALEETVAVFKADPHGIKNLHDTASRRYGVFCRRRTADLYTTFFALIGEEDLSWCGEATYVPSFLANVPWPGKTNERPVSGGRSTKSKKMHGLVRYAYKGNAIEECRKDGKEHGLRITCTVMGDLWIRLYKNGQRLAQIVLHADLSVQSAIDGGGLKKLRQHMHLVRDCFVQEEVKGEEGKR